MSEPTEMELRACDAIWADIAAQASYSRKSNYPNEVCVDGDFDLLHAVRAAIRAMLPDIETMDGAVMNAMCEAFHDGIPPLPVYPQDGLTAACTRAVAAYIDSASPPIDGESNG